MKLLTLSGGDAPEFALDAGFAAKALLAIAKADATLTMTNVLALVCVYRGQMTRRPSGIDVISVSIRYGRADWLALAIKAPGEFAVNCLGLGGTETYLLKVRSGSVLTVVDGAGRRHGDPEDLRSDPPSPADAWVMSGERGASSEAMAFAMFGTPVIDEGDEKDMPIDVSDFGRCVGLVKAVPDARAQFAKVAALSRGWAKLIDDWDELVELHSSGEHTALRARLDFARSLNQRQRRAA